MTRAEPDRPTSTDPRAPGAHRGHSEFTRVRGLMTHAWVRGEGEPLVIVPGLGCASWMYLRVSRELARERRVYVYDPPGQGYSEGRWDYPTGIGELSDHLAAWLRESGLKCAPLFGHSLGGEVILDLAARHAECATALIACAPTGVPENPSVRVQFLRLLRDLPRERPQLLVPGFRAYASTGARRMYLLAQDQSGHDLGPLLGQVNVPTLLLAGSRDPVIHAWTVKSIKGSVPDATERIIQGGTHALTDTHPQAVARFTLDFLNRVEAAGKCQTVQ